MLCKNVMVNNSGGIADFFVVMDKADGHSTGTTRNIDIYRQIVHDNLRYGVTGFT